MAGPRDRLWCEEGKGSRGRRRRPHCAGDECADQPGH